MRQLAVVLVWAMVLVPGARAQSGFVGLGLGYLLTGGKGVGPGDCLQSSYPLGLGARAGYDLVGTSLALQASARANALEGGVTCVDGFPPLDGTYQVEEYRNLTAERFALTDLGVRGTIAGVAAGGTVALGVGTAWRSGPNPPYLVASASVFLRIKAVRLLMGAEVYRFRFRFERFERTYQGGQITTNVPLGTTHEWSSAGVVTLGAELTLGH